MELTTEEKTDIIKALDLSSFGEHPYKVDIEFNWYGTSLSLTSTQPYVRDGLIRITVKERAALQSAVSFMRTTAETFITAHKHEH